LLLMGQETKAKARIEGGALEGRLYLESDQLLFRGGGMRLAIAVKNIKGASANGGTLVLAVGRKKYQFDIGTLAQRWADRISNPRTLVQKLGVKSDSTIAYIGARDAKLLAELESAAEAVSKKCTRRDYDLIFVGVEKPSDLELLEGLGASIKSNGGLWVIFPKGTPDLKAEIIIPKVKSRGLVDIKVARVSDRLTGMKFVIPVHLRK
jgi:hypothetical protein